MEEGDPDIQTPSWKVCSESVLVYSYATDVNKRYLGRQYARDFNKTNKQTWDGNSNVSLSSE